MCRVVILVAAGAILLNEFWKLSEVASSTVGGVIEQTGVSVAVVTEETGE